MFGTIKAKSADEELLSKALYEDVFRNLFKKLKGGKTQSRSFVFYPELTLSWVLSNRASVIKIIIDEIKRDDFSFDAIKHSVIVTDKARDIYIAAWPERVLMLALGQILTRRLAPMISKHVYSFQKGRGPHEAVRAATDFIRSQRKRPLYVLKRDISKYGDSIPQPKLFAALEIATDIRKSPLFYKLLKAAVRAPFRNKNDEAAASLCVGIPSGSPLVPPLENFYLSPLDRKLGDIDNTFYGRYGDDIIFITPDRHIADWAMDEINKTVSNLGLEIKPQKMTNARLDYFKRLPDDEYQHKTHVTWLGFSLTNHGFMGIKHNHLEIILDTLKTEIASLFSRSKAAELGYDDQIGVIRNGLCLLLQKNAATALSSYIYYHTDHQIYRLIDKRVVQLVFKGLVKDLSLPKKEAWRVLRRLKIPSTYYIRFLDKNKYKHRKKTKLSATEQPPSVRSSEQAA